MGMFAERRLQRDIQQRMKQAATNTETLASQLKQRCEEAADACAQYTTLPEDVQLRGQEIHDDCCKAQSIVEEHILNDRFYQLVIDGFHRDNTNAARTEHLQEDITRLHATMEELQQKMNSLKPSYLRINHQHSDVLGITIEQYVAAEKAMDHCLAELERLEGNIHWTPETPEKAALREQLGTAMDIVEATDYAGGIPIAEEYMACKETVTAKEEELRLLARINVLFDGETGVGYLVKMNETMQEQLGTLTVATDALVAYIAMAHDEEAHVHSLKAIEHFGNDAELLIAKMHGIGFVEQ